MGNGEQEKRGTARWMLCFRRLRTDGLAYVPTTTDKRDSSRSENFGTLLASCDSSKKLVKSGTAGGFFQVSFASEIPYLQGNLTYLQPLLQHPKRSRGELSRCREPCKPFGKAERDGICPRNMACDTKRALRAMQRGEGMQRFVLARAFVRDAEGRVGHNIEGVEIELVAKIHGAGLRGDT